MIRLARRPFMQHSLVAGISGMTLFRTAAMAAEAPSNALQLDAPTKLFDQTKCYAHPRCGIVPGAGIGGGPAVVMTLNTVDLIGSDVFRAVHGMRTDDLGKTWTTPKEIVSLMPWRETVDGVERPVALSDYWPKWHAATKTLLGTGHNVYYTPDWQVPHPRPRQTMYAIYDPAADAWSPPQKLPMPDPARFVDSGAGCTQRYDLEDGAILLPFYFRPPGHNSIVAVMRASFDGKSLKYEERGDELTVDPKTRGFHEPSLARFAGKFYLTLRNDIRGYVTRGDDGLHYEPYRPWLWDDGTELGNYNTQQHWVTHSDGLFLVYTRRGANNDHVMRNRAPLFMAQVDPDRLCVLRSTEQILMPERGARLGNFGVCDVSPDETWVTDSEWMQPKGVEARGSDGTVWVARVRWSRPNREFRI